MASDCRKTQVEVTPEIIGKESNRDLREINRKFTALYRSVVKGTTPEDMLLRAGLGLAYRTTGLSEGSIDGAFKIWAWQTAKYEVDESKPPTMEQYVDMATAASKIRSDVRSALAEGQRLIDKYGSVDNIPNDPKVLGKIHGRLSRFLPVSMRLHFVRKFVDGERLFNDINATEFNHKSKIQKAGNSLQEIVSSLEKLIGKGAYKADSKEMVKIMELERKADKKLQVMVEAGADDMLLQNQRGKVDRLRERRVKMQDAENRTAVLHSAMVDIVRNHGFAPGRIDMAKLADRLGLGPEGRRELVRLKKHVTDSLDDFAGILKETDEINKRLMRFELQRLGVSERHIEEIMARVPELELKRDGKFFPLQRVTDSVTLEGLVTKLANMDYDDSVGSGSRETLSNLINVHTKHQKGAVDDLLANKNILDVLHQYFQSTMHTNYVAKTKLVMEEHLQNILETWEATGDERVAAMLKAMEAALNTARSRTYGTQSHGAFDDITSAVISLGAVKYLGFIRAASMLRNAVDSNVLLAGNIGIHNYFRIKSQLGKSGSGMRKRVDEVKTKSNVTLGDEILWDANLETVRRNTLTSILGDDPLVNYLIGVERERAAMWREVVSRSSGKVRGAASVAMKPWMVVENKLRNSAMDVAMAYSIEKTDRELSHFFADQTFRIPANLIKMYGLDGDALNNTTGKMKPEEVEEARREAYNIVLEKKALRDALNIVGQTQMIYTRLARHPMETWDKDGKGITRSLGKAGGFLGQYMFEWNANFMISMREVYHRTKVGGFKSIKASPRDQDDGWSIDPAWAWWITLGTVMGLGLAFETDAAKKLVKIKGYARTPVGDYIRALAEPAMAKNENDKKWANYGKSFFSTIGGPAVNEAEWLLNAVAVSAGRSREEIPESLRGIAQFFGYNPDAEVLGMEGMTLPEAIVNRQIGTTGMSRDVRDGYEAVKEFDPLATLKWLMNAAVGIELGTKFQKENIDKRSEEDNQENRARS